MPRVLLTGMPGGGKSSALAELGRRGYRVVDTDDSGWCEYRPYAEPLDALHRGEWHWVEERMARLLDTNDGRPLFVAGRVANQSTFYDRFDAVVLLRAPVPVLLDRVRQRTTNDYGKTPVQRAEILADLTEIEPGLRQDCTHELDTDRPLEDVVADLIAIASEAGGRAFRVALPVLSDGRVLLRPAEHRDLPAIEAAMHDADVLRWIGQPEGSAHDVLVRDEERWAQGSPTLSICELDGTCVGKVWMHVPDAGGTTGYVGYWLLPAGRGRGLATGAVRLISDWAIRDLGITNVRLTTAPDNVRSHRVAERTGFRRVTESARPPTESGTADLVYELERDREMQSAETG